MEEEKKRLKNSYKVTKLLNKSEIFELVLFGCTTVHRCYSVTPVRPPT
jgi:hypothetical protein